MGIKGKKVSIAELFYVSGTRVLLGIGIGLLIANYIRPPHRVGTGWALFLIGFIAMFPFWFHVATRKNIDE